MAGSARIVEASRREVLGISDRCFRALQPDVLSARAVASLTLDSGLERHDSRPLRHLQRTSRMTLETTQDGRTGVERPISLACRTSVPWREHHPFGLLEVSQPVFEVIILVQMTDERDRLLPRAKGPVTEALRKSRSQRMFRWLRQCSSMACWSVSGELRRMTPMTFLTSCILALCDAGQKQQK